MKPSPLELKTAKQMRQNVISGKWFCGEKLPPYSRLEKMFPVSRVTLHRAVTRLQREGFLNGFERKGVYVSENPPHLKRVALLLGSPEKHNRFSAILARDSAVIGKEKGYEIVVLTHQNRVFYDVAEGEELLGDLALNRYAGMIVTFNPKVSPLPGIFNTDIPKVYLSGSTPKGGFSVGLDNRALAYNAMKYLKDNGAKRVAVLAHGCGNPLLRYARDMFDEFGFELRPEWAIGFDNEDMSEPIARLMFAASREQRPDGLFIADDNFTEHVARGIMARGIKVPDELKIISHCNWSMPPKRLVPMELIGFDSRRIISEGLHIIEMYNGGGKPEHSISLPPIMEGELKSS
jgi:DNA-binding LacI/PurR family transcriptional regulator